MPDTPTELERNVIEDTPTELERNAGYADGAAVGLGE